MFENKDIIIKDIKKIIDNRCEAELGQVHASSMNGKVTKTVDTSLIAKDIYEQCISNLILYFPKDKEVELVAQKFYDMSESFGAGVYYYHQSRKLAQQLGAKVVDSGKK